VLVLIRPPCQAHPVADGGVLGDARAPDVALLHHVFCDVGFRHFAVDSLHRHHRDVASQVQTERNVLKRFVMS